jgi:hypothetical protein
MQKKKRMRRGWRKLQQLEMVSAFRLKIYDVRLLEWNLCFLDVGKLRKRWEVRSHVLDAVFNKCGKSQGFR